MGPFRILLHVENVEFSEFLYRELSGSDFQVERVFSRNAALEILQAEDFPVYIAPAGWAPGQDTEIDEIIHIRRIFAMTSGGLARHPEPRALLPLLKKFVEHQRLLDETLIQILHHQSGLVARDEKLRMSLEVPVQYEFLGTGEGEGRTVDLSPRGFFVALKSNEALPKAEQEFCFKIHARESRIGSVSGTARVRWICDATLGKSPRSGNFRNRIGFGAEIV